MFELTKRFNALGETVLFTGGIDNPVDPAGLVPPVESRSRKFLIQLLYFHSLLTYDGALEFEASLEHVSSFSLRFPPSPPSITHWTSRSLS